MRSRTRIDETEGEPDGDASNGRKTVIVVGDASVLRRAVGRAFLEEDWRVWVVGSTDPSSVDPGPIEYVEADDRSVDAAVGEIFGAVDRVDCLVIIPRRTPAGAVEDLSDEELANALDANVSLPHALVRRIVPLMRVENSGRIVILTNVIGRTVLPGWGGFGASLAALTALGDALRNEVKTHGIDVSIVESWFPQGWLGTDEFTIEPDPQSAYPELDRLLEDLETVGGFPPKITPERIADVILEAATSTDPEPRYTVGPIAQVESAARFLPSRIKDLAIRIATKVFS